MNRSLLCRRLATFWLVALMWAPLGCTHAVMLSAARPDSTSPSDSTDSPPTDSGDEQSAANAETSEADERFRAKLERIAWGLHPNWTPDSSALEEWDFGQGACEPLRWTFPGLTDLVEAVDDVDADRLAKTDPAAATALAAELHRLAGVESPVARNAAIALVHWSPADGPSVIPFLETIACRPPAPSGNPKLLDLDPARNPKTPQNWKELAPTSMRCAAAEAWCLALASRPGEAEANLAPAGRALKDKTLPAEVHGELMRALALWIPPARIPGVIEAFETLDDEDATVVRAPLVTRRAAVEACLIHAWRLRAVRSPPDERVAEDLEELDSPSRESKSSDEALSEWSPENWPDAIHRARLDPSSSVRRTYGRWLAVAGAPNALSRLKTQLSDTEPRVRHDALVSLGILGSEPAREILLKQLKQPEERLREFAARGLCWFGPSAVAASIRDEAPNVRAAVAEELQERPSIESAALLRTLLDDRNAQVQVSAARTLGRWPDDLAIPLLLQGMQSEIRKTRDLCWNDLRRRKGFSDDYPIDESPTERAAFVQQIVADAHLQTALASLPRFETSRPRAAPTLSPDEVERILEQLHSFPVASPAYQQAKSLTQEWTARELPVIEQEIFRHGGRASPFVEQELLPRLNPAYAALQELSDADVFVRRRGAQALSRIARETTLPVLLTARLYDLMTIEQDQLVWRLVMSSVFEDDMPEAARLAELAVNHTWPDVRVLGCGYARRHARPQYARWLLPLLSDKNRAVQMAAIEAAGACRNPLLIEGLPARGENPAWPGLSALMNGGDARLGIAVAAAMSDLGDERGMQELIRLSFSESAEMRAEATRAMGRSGQARFIEPMIRQCWTESIAQVRRASLTALEELVPQENHPPELGGATSDDAKIRAWTAWQQRRSPMPGR